MKRLALFSLLILLAVGCKDSDSTPTPVPVPVKKYVHVKGNKLIAPNGRPVFLKIATWENPFEGSVTEKTVKNFMGVMAKYSLNCILLKGNMWLIHDDRTPNRHNVNVMHRLIKHAEARGIYVILNMFDVWSRGKGSNQYNVDSRQHPINVWDRNHKDAAQTYTKWVAREFKKHPLVIFELGNEMEGKHSPAQLENFKFIARKCLVHFYAIAGKDRPIGVSQKLLWGLPVNVLFNHDPGRIGPPPGNKAMITNELAYDTDLWKDSSIRNPGRYPEYKAAFKRAKANDHSGCAAATILNINHPLNSAAVRVLKALGGM